MIYVPDASALQAFLRQEPGGDVVRLLLRDPANTCFAHVVNLCEVFCDFHRASGEPAAQAVIATLLAASVLPRDDMDTAFWQQAWEVVQKRKAEGRRRSPEPAVEVICLYASEGERYVRDLRTDVRPTQVKEVLKGELDEFILAYLKTAEAARAWNEVR
jgi:hypothetical protein